MSVRRRTILFSAAATLAAPSIVRAQTLPPGPVRLIHGYDAGSNPDTIARHLAPSLTEILGVQIVIEPKPGAAERLAASQIARMKPDGGVLYLMTGGQAVVSATDKHAVLRRAARLRLHLDRHALSLRLHLRARFALQDHRGLSRRGQAPSRASSPTAPRASARPCTWRWSCCCRRLGAKMTHVPYKGGIGAPYNDLDRRPARHAGRDLLQRPAAAQDRQAARARRHVQGAPSGLPRRADGRREDWCPTTTSCRGSASPRRPACRRPCATAVRGASSGDGAARRQGQARGAGQRHAGQHTG